MRADAHILMRSEWHEDPLHPSHGYTTEVPVRWEGGPIARIDWYGWHTLFKEPPSIGAQFTLGTWRLVVVALEGDKWQSIYVTRNTTWAWWYALRFRFARHWPLFKNRVLATCAVWGLAKYEWNAAPSWLNIYAVAWLKAKVKR